jgi:hypothetical protein
MLGHAYPSTLRSAHNLANNLRTLGERAGGPRPARSESSPAQGTEDVYSRDVHTTS